MDPTGIVSAHPLSQQLVDSGYSTLQTILSHMAAVQAYDFAMLDLLAQVEASFAYFIGKQLELEYISRPCTPWCTRAPEMR
jgi:hypothetical protein